MSDESNDDPKPRSPGLRALHDRYIGDDPDRVASYRAELEIARAEHATARSVAPEHQAVVDALRARRHTAEADAERDRFREAIRREIPPKDGGWP